jgi:hypothetical protein
MKTLYDSGTGVRFSRRLGEQVADAHYACALEGPRMNKPDTVVTIACLVAAVALIVIIKVYG